MTIVTELKKLAKTITGKDASGETIDQVLDSFNENYHGEQPADFEFAVEYSSGQYLVTTEATYSVIEQALDSGKTVRAVITATEEEETVYGTVSTVSPGSMIHFTGVWVKFGNAPNVFVLTANKGDPDFFIFDVTPVSS